MRLIKCDRCGAEIPGGQDTVGFVGVELKDITDRTLREKSRTKEMYTLSLGKIAILADLAGYEIEFRKKAVG